MTRTASSLLAGLGLVALTLLPNAPVGAATQIPITGRASVLPGAVEANGHGTSRDPIVSSTGREIVFSTTARLTAADTDASEDVYVKDLVTDQLELVSVSTGEVPAVDTSRSGAISSDGRFVVFWSWAPNLVPNDTNGKADVFVRDRLNGTTERVSVSSAEAQANGASPSIINGDSLDITSDGRFVTFTSTATNLGPDGNTLSDVFVRDRLNGTTELVSVSSAEAIANGTSYAPTLSGTGRYVAFESDASNLVTGDTNSARDIFVRDRQSGVTTRVSLTDGDGQAPQFSTDATIDEAGSKVVFSSVAKLVPGDTNAIADVYVRDRNVASTTWMSQGVGGAQPNDDSTDPVISGDGKSVVWLSAATNLVGGGGNGWVQVFLRRNGVTERLSLSSSGVVALGDADAPAVSQTGSVVAWDATSANLVPGDSGMRDVFFRKVPAIGPYASTEAFAAGVVSDFGGTTAAATVTAAVKAGSSPAHQVVTLANSSAWASKRAPLTRLYVAYFKRLPDLAGFEYWRNRMANGMSLDQVSASFAASAEFKAKYGNTTNTAFVTLVYQNVLDRQPDAAGLAHWVAQLQGGMSRGRVMTLFSESSEGKRHFTGWVQPTLLSLGMLGTMPPAALFAKLREAAELDSAEDAATILLSSPQYAATI